MKKILSMLLTVLFIVTVFVGCTADTDDATTEPTTVAEEAVDAVVDELTEDVSVESTTTDENGNEITIGKDADGNTVEVKTNKDGTVTKTVTDKETGKKTEQTTTVAPKPVTTTAKSQQTTKKSETTTKKSTPQTTKKPETTTKKPAQTTTTKPVQQTATTTTKPPHTHKFVTKSKQVLVKEAWDETTYETVTKREEHSFCMTCGLDETEAYRRGDIPGCTSVSMFHMKHVKQTHPNTTGNAQGGKIVTVTEKVPKTVHHDAQYKTETWEECSCGATQNRHKV